MPRAMLGKLSGREHQVHTGLRCAPAGGIAIGIATTQVDSRR